MNAFDRTRLNMDKSIIYAVADIVDSIHKQCNVDYSSHQEKILEHYDTVCMEGNWDSTLEFDDLPDIRLIQADEYEQHMDDPDNEDEDNDVKIDQNGEEVPEPDCDAGNHYIFLIRK